MEFKKSTILIWIMLAISIGTLTAALVHAFVVRRGLDQTLQEHREIQEAELREQSVIMRRSILRDLEGKYEDDIQAYKDLENVMREEKAKAKKMKTTLKARESLEEFKALQELEAIEDEVPS